MGPNPRGRLMLTPDGFMTGLIVAADRTPERSESELAARCRTMLANTGRYRLAGDRFVTVSPWAPHPLKPDAPAERGILRWLRER